MGCGLSFYPMAEKSWEAKVYGRKDNSMNPTQDEKWIKLRSQIFERDHFRCQVRNCRTPTEILTTHHIKPRNRGGRDTKHNLITLCARHHDIIELDSEIYSTPKLISEYDDNPLQVHTPIPTRLCRSPDCEESKQGLVCWHMVVYGGISNQYIGQPIKEHRVSYTAKAPQGPPRKENEDE